MTKETYRTSDIPSPISDEALAERAQAGDRAAFEKLCDRALPYVYSRLRALLPPEAVEDVTQEVFMAALHAIRRYRSQARFRTWISAICRHKVADFYRRRSRRPEVVPLDEHAANPAVQQREWEESALTRIVLRRLPGHYQEVIVLRIAEGMSFDQVAATLGISLEATKSRFRRAIAAMAREMEEDTCQQE